MTVEACSKAHIFLQLFIHSLPLSRNNLEALPFTCYLWVLWSPGALACTSQGIFGFCYFYCFWSKNILQVLPARLEVSPGWNLCLILLVPDSAQPRVCPVKGLSECLWWLIRYCISLDLTYHQFCKIHDYFSHSTEETKVSCETVPWVWAASQFQKCDNVKIQCVS